VRSNELRIYSLRCTYLCAHVHSSKISKVFLLVCVRACVGVCEGTMSAGQFLTYMRTCTHACIFECVGMYM